MDISAVEIIGKYDVYIHKKVKYIKNKINDYISEGIDNLDQLRYNTILNNLWDMDEQTAEMITKYDVYIIGRVEHNILREKDKSQDYVIVKVLPNNRIIMSYIKRVYIWNPDTFRLDYEKVFPDEISRIVPLTSNIVILNNNIYHTEKDEILHELDKGSIFVSHEGLIFIEKHNIVKGYTFNKDSYELEQIMEVESKYELLKVSDTELFFTKDNYLHIVNIPYGDTTQVLIQQPEEQTYEDEMYREEEEVNIHFDESQENLSPYQWGSSTSDWNSLKSPWDVSTPQWGSDISDGSVQELYTESIHEEKRQNEEPLYTESPKKRVNKTRPKTEDEHKQTIREERRPYRKEIKIPSRIFVDENKMVSNGYRDFIVWDLRNGYILLSENVRVRDFVFISSDIIVYASETNLVIFNIRTQRHIYILDLNEIFRIKLMNDYIIIAFGDGNISLFSLYTHDLRSLRKEHETFITDIEVVSNNRFVTTSVDLGVKLWG